MSECPSRREPGDSAPSAPRPTAGLRSLRNSAPDPTPPGEIPRRCHARKVWPSRNVVRLSDVTASGECVGLDLPVRAGERLGAGGQGKLGWMSAPHAGCDVDDTAAFTTTSAPLVAGVSVVRGHLAEDHAVVGPPSRHEFLVRP